MSNRPTNILCNTMLVTYMSKRFQKTFGRHHYFIKIPVFKEYSIQCRNFESAESSYIIKSPYKHLDIPNIALPELLSEKLEKFSKNIAIECGVSGRKYTFLQLQKLSRKFAVSLLKAGLKPGDVVGLITYNCPEYPIVYLGCLEAGLVISPINHVYTADEIHNQLTDSGAKCVVSAIETLDTVKTAVSQINSTVSPEHHVKLIVLDTNSSSGSLSAEIGRFSQLTADYIDESGLSTLKAKPSELVVLPYSSGTTGLPKGVKLSHKNIVSNLLQKGNPETTPFFETSETHQDVVPAILPFYHIYGLTQILGNCLLFGSKIISLPKFEPKTLLDTLKYKKCTILYLVPPLILFLGNSSHVTSAHVQHARWIISGAAPLGASDLERCLNKLSSKNTINYVQGYGLTETSPVIAFPPRGNQVLSSVGSPLSNTLMKVTHVETGKPLGPNESGEICVKGPQVMMGYLNNPSATASTIDEDGWLHTGDLGHYDEQGLFYITDRIKELIKVKGFQVPPAELEEVMRTMPGISDAGVIGVKDRKAGEVPVAFVVCAPSSSITSDDVKAFMSTKVAPFKQPSEVFIMDSLPKSGAGKLLRKEIVKIYDTLKNKVKT